MNVDSETNRTMDDNMPIPIADRELSSVSVISIELDWNPSGEHLAGGMCHIELSGPDGGDGGPGANIFFALPVDPAMPLEDVANSVVKRTHEIVQRMASFSAEDFQKSFLEWRVKQDEQKKQAAASGYSPNVRG